MGAQIRDSVSTARDESVESRRRRSLFPVARLVSGASRALSHAHESHRESAGLLDAVAVGGINTGRDAYIAHLCGARAVQVGSALMTEGAGALPRIDRELATLLAEQGRDRSSRLSDWPGSRKTTLPRSLSVWYGREFAPTRRGHRVVPIV